MAFSQKERKLLLEAPYVGDKVVDRLEEIGIDSLKKLKKCSVESVTNLVAEMLGTTCWKNSPQAKKAIANAIAVANQHS